MTEKLYLANASLPTLSATVTSVRTLEDGRHAARLDRTIFHAQGGGQRADRGRLGEAQVLHAMHDGPNVDHIIDRQDVVSVGQQVVLELDHAWRALNTAFHTAGHLLAGVMEARYPSMRAVSGHQWPGEARVEFEAEGGACAVELTALNQVLAQAISEDWPVQLRGDPYSNRQVQIGALPPMACGGTHLQRLGELRTLVVGSVKAKGSRVRMSYTATQHVP